MTKCKAVLMVTINMKTDKVSGYFVASTEHCASMHPFRHFVLETTHGSTFESARRRMNDNPTFRQLYINGKIKG